MYYHKISKNDICSNSSTDWTTLSLDFTVEKYGIKLIDGEIDTALAYMSFSNNTITFFVDYMNHVDYLRDFLNQFLITEKYCYN